MLIASFCGTILQGSVPFSMHPAVRSAKTWARVPVAARELISRDLGSDQHRFAVTRSGASLLARSSEVSATFDRSGATVRGRSGTSLLLGLTAIGRSGSLSTIGSVSPVSKANVVSYRHTGIDEWYANGPLGLEQGFTVQRRMTGAGDLVLVVGSVPTGAKVAVTTGGSSLTITGARGRSLHYSDLSVTDAAGHHLPARVAVSGGRILVRVDDARAHYPLLIDPVIGDGAELIASGTAYDDEYGYSVATSDDGRTIVVGAPFRVVGSHDQGAAYVFSEPATGGWQDASQTAELTASDGADADLFGSSVSISGDGATIAVGAPADAGGAVAGQGSAYVFSEPISGGWQNATQTAELTASDGAADDGFGGSIAISDDGSTVVAGAPHHAVASSNDQGAAYVFSEPATGGWQNASQTAELTASDGAADDVLGTSVAVSGSGDTVVAGAPTAAGSAGDQGAAYVFSEPASGGWRNATEAAELTPNFGALSGRDWFGFGQAVAISAGQSTIAVTALQLPQGADGTGGAAAVLVFSEPISGGWQDATQTSVLTQDASESSQAVAVSSDGSQIVVGSLPGSFATLVFGEGASGGWQDPTETGDLYGDASQSVAVAGDEGTVVLGGAEIATVFPPLPVASSPPTVSGSPVQGQTLTETNGVWSNYPIGYSYQWADCDGAGQNCSPIAGATDQSYTLTSSDVGSTVEAQETAGNITGFGSPADSAATPVVQPLSATSAPTISGPAVQGQTLTEAHASWNTSVTGYAYQWKRCDRAGANCAAIADTTSESYTLTNADAGHTIVVQETASNAGGSGITASSAATAVVTPLAPTSSSVPTVSGTTVEGDTLTASLLAWTNTPTSVSYQWEDCDSTGQNCQPIAGATSKTYTLAASDIGHRIVVVESAANAGGTSTPAASAATGAVPESGPVGLEIDNGDYATNNPHVTIEAVWPAGTQSILISNNGGFRTDTQTVAPAATLYWTLEQTGSDRLPKTVYLRFLGVGQDDLNFTDDIILDETAPTIQSATLSGSGTAQASAARAARRVQTYKLRLKAKDQLVGVCEAATNQRRSSQGEALTRLTSCTARGIPKVSRMLNLKLRAQPRYVRVRNSAGDWSRWLEVKPINAPRR